MPRPLAYTALKMCRSGPRTIIPATRCTRRRKRCRSLASKVNLPYEAVSSAAQAFNQAYAAGEADAFGRKLNAPLSEEGPYYALRVYVRYYATLGGLHINDNMQVLTTAQEAIPGLYGGG